ncbi:MAG: phosphopentomutase [Bacillota bacterium]|nr:phosphopentomutase [Bacillota bacterium]
MKRVVLIVLDSVGIGALPDACKYKDEGSNTIGHIAKTLGLNVPNMRMLGLANIEAEIGLEKVPEPIGAYGKLAEVSSGKDTTTGHWEIAGIKLEKAFPTYPNGFPPDIVNALQNAFETNILCNSVASGTEIIARLGDEHVKTGYPIVYTSADSVLQIAAHEDIYPPEKLYDLCRKARSIMTGEHAVGRIIARPFTGTSGSYTRTKNRRDFSLNPIAPTVLDAAVEKGYSVCAVGKIEDIFAGKGITKSNHISGNSACIDATLEYMKTSRDGIIFTNLVDFDMLYGHRNDVVGYKNALEYFDSRIPELTKSLEDDDILLITADHGCDPTTPSTDHSREYIPLLIFGKNVKSGVNIGTRKTFSDIAETISEYLDLNKSFGAKSFLNEIRRK